MFVGICVCAAKLQLFFAYMQANARFSCKKYVFALWNLYISNIFCTFAQTLKHTGVGTTEKINI